MRFSLLAKEEHMMEKRITELSERIRLERSQGKRVRKWPEEVRRECVDLLKSGVEIKVLSRRVGVSVVLLKEWKSEGAGPGMKEVVVLEESKAPRVLGERVERTFILRTLSGMVIEDLSFEDLTTMKQAGFL
jgi:transposase-like protein